MQALFPTVIIRGEGTRGKLPKESIFPSSLPIFDPRNSNPVIIVCLPAGSIELQQNVNGEIVEEVKEESPSHAKEEAHSHVKEEAHSHAYRNADPELLQQFARKPKGICGEKTADRGAGKNCKAFTMN